MLSATHPITVEPLHEGSQAGEFRRPVCMLRHGLANTMIVFDATEPYFRHLEAAHHLPVPRFGETDAHAVRRFLTQHPEARDCGQCAAAGAPWTATGKERSR